jgi:hypothetical protein
LPGGFPGGGGDPFKTVPVASDLWEVMNTARFVLLLALLAAVLYAPTWSPLVTWAHYGEDGPELEAAGRTLGVAHPTGYPLFILLARVAALGLPAPVSAVNVLTLLAAMAAVAAAGLLGRALTARAFPDSAVAGWTGGFTAGAVLATSLTLWRQASIGEVYTLHLALAAGVLVLVVHDTPRARLGAAYLLGLAFCHHLLAVPLAAVVLVHAAARPGRPRAATVVAFVVPLTLYGVLMVRSGRNPVFDWGDPETLRGLWWTVSGAPYRGNLLADGFLAAVVRTGTALRDAPVTQLGWGGAVLAGTGLYLAAARIPRQGLALLLVWAGSTLVASAYAIPDPAAYHLPAVLALAAAAGLAAGGLMRLAAAVPAPARPAAAAAVLAVAAGCVAAQVQRVRPLADATGEVGAAVYAEAVGSLEPDALILSHGDGRTFSLWYGAAVLHPRPDVAVVYDTLLDWSWYRRVLAREHPEVHLPRPGASLAARRRGLVERHLGLRPVYVTDLDPGMLDRYAVLPVGPLYRLVRTDATAAASTGTRDRAASRRPG